MGRDFDRIRREHLRSVKVTKFAHLWSQAEQRSDALRAEDQVDWYLVGVLAACRWIANAWIPYDGTIDGRNGEMAKTPLTLKSAWVIEELIEEETLCAERLVGRWEWPGRPGYVEGVAARRRTARLTIDRAAERLGTTQAWTSRLSSKHMRARRVLAEPREHCPPQQIDLRPYLEETERPGSTPLLRATAGEMSRGGQRRDLMPTMPAAIGEIARVDSDGEPARPAHVADSPPGRRKVACPPARRTPSPGLFH